MKLLSVEEVKAIREGWNKYGLYYAIDGITVVGLVDTLEASLKVVEAAKDHECVEPGCEDCGCLICNALKPFQRGGRE